MYWLIPDRGHSGLQMWWSVSAQFLEEKRSTEANFYVGRRRRFAQIRK